MPGEIMIQKDQGDDEAYDHTYLQVSWPVAVNRLHTDGSVDGDVEAFTSSREISFHARTWKFDGHFSQATEEITIVRPLASDSTYLISDMVAYPIRYAKEGTKERLLRRGQMFWDCRFRQYVSYCGWNYNHNEYTVGPVKCGTLLTTNRLFLCRGTSGS